MFGDEPSTLPQRLRSVDQAQNDFVRLATEKKRKRRAFEQREPVRD
jgi:hypothetical protein